MKNAIIYLLASLVMPLSANIANGQRAISEQQLAYPVLIISESGTGTGFYIWDDSYIYLATAKHVIFNKQGLLKSDEIKLISYPESDTIKGKFALKINMLKMNVKKNIKWNNESEAALIRIGHIGENSGIKYDEDLIIEEKLRFKNRRKTY